MGAPGAADKNQRRAIGKSGLCSRQLAGDCCLIVPQSTGQFYGAVWSHENGQNPVRKAQLQSKEVLCQMVTRSELGACKDFLLLNLRQNPPFLM